MALELKLTIGAFDKDTNTLALTDTTGVYHVTNNPTGYGAPNEERANLALVISTRVSTKLGENVQFDDPLTDSAFNYVFTSDNSYDVYLCGLPIEASPDVSLLAEGYVYYDSDANLIYKVELVNAVKTAVETTEVIDNSSYVTEIQYFLVTSQLEGTQISYFCDAFSDRKCNPLREEYGQIDRILESIRCYFEEGYYAEVLNLSDLGRKIKFQ